MGDSRVKSFMVELTAVQIYLERVLFSIWWVCLLCFIAVLFFEMGYHKVVPSA